MTHNKISIGICTSNDIATIKALLDDLYNITSYHDKLNDEFTIQEIIVVSSGSNDGTNNVLTEFQKKFDCKLNVIVEKTRKGKSSALNIIFQKYSGDVLVLLPADIRITKKKTLFHLQNYFKNNPLVGVVSGSPVLNHNIRKCNTACRVGALIWRLHNKNLEKLHIEENSHASGEIMAVRKGIISHIPPSVINDDAYISVYARQRKWLVGYEPRAQVYISTPHTLRDYYIQRKRVVMGHKQLRRLKKNDSSTSKSMFWSKPIFILLAILHSFHYPSDVLYFLIAFVIELNIEIQSLLKLTTTHATSSVWQRITIDKATQL